MICPKCGSNAVYDQIVHDTTVETQQKGFSCSKACCGYFFFDVWGILCGLCGSGKTRTRTSTKQRVLHICQTCGNRF